MNQRQLIAAAEQVAFGREGAGVGQAGHDLVAHDALEFADPRLVLDSRAERAAVRPQAEVPVLQLRPALAVHVGTHALEQDRRDLAVHDARAHARREIEERVHRRAQVLLC